LPFLTDLMADDFGRVDELSLICLPDRN
jgi:hypothetical protein